MNSKQQDILQATINANEVINAFINESNDAIIIASDAGYIELLNINAEKIIPSIKASNAMIFDILPQLGIDQKLSTNIQQILQSEKQLFTEFRHFGIDTVTYYETCIKRMTNGKIMINLRDISIRKAALSNLEENNKKLKKVNNQLDKKRDDLSEAVTQLVKSNEYYRSLLQDSIDGIIISDFTGKILTINNQALKLIAYTKQEIESIQFQNLFTEFEIKRHPLDYEKIKLGKIVIKERYLKKKDESQIPVEMKSRLLSGNKIQTIIKDISSEKQAKLELIQSEKKYRELVENITDVIFECDTNLIVRFSNGALQFLGYNSPTEIYGDSLASHIHGEERAIFQNQLNNLKPQKHTCSEFRFCTAQGEYQWVRINIKSKYEHGLLQGYFGTISDISKQKNAELGLKEKNEELQIFNEEYLSQNEELRTALEEINEKNEIIEETVEKLNESKETFRTITENTPDIICRLNLQGYFTYISKNIYNYLNINYKEIVNKHISEIRFDTFFIEKFIEHFQLAKLSQKAQSFTHELDNNLIKSYLEVRLVPEFCDHNKISSILSIIRDISKQKKTEFELIKSKEKAEESDKLKSAFLANMSHEIRTPLNGIIGFSNLLYDENIESNERFEYIETINNCSNQLLSIITDIIDISKIEAKQIEINTESCNLNSILFSQKQLLEIEKERLSKTQISIIIDIPDIKNDIIILTDETRLKQIITNLGGNALKFTETGTVTIGYKIQNQTILFYISDTGIGIPDKDREIIFERFRQSESKRDQLYGGTGLGLSICKGLLSFLNGEIWVESEIGNGSTFFFTLPYHVVGTKKTELKTISNQEADFTGITILIIEDTSFSQQYFKAVFKGTSAKIILADNAEDGIRIFKEVREISLILMDICLPGMNGLEATKIIRSLSATIPIIAQTANAMADDKQKALSAGCSSYIAKPIRKKELFNMLQYCLKI